MVCMWEGFLYVKVPMRAVDLEMPFVASTATGRMRLSF